jgi:hypothetical protein
MRRAGLSDVLCGLIFLGFGAAFGYAASGYPLGTAVRMGPGYFPLLLAGLLGLLGAAIVAKGVTAAAAEGEIGTIPWRGIVLVLAALVFFGATVRGLGLVAGLLGTAFLSALASRRNGPVAALAIAAALTLMCVAIFHFGLGLTIPLVGPWIGR